jgi:hypothetical protein
LTRGRFLSVLDYEVDHKTEDDYPDSEGKIGEESE